MGNIGEYCLFLKKYRVVLLRLRGSLDYARDDGTRSGFFTRINAPPGRFFAYALNDNRGGCLTMGGVASH